jgi:antitoxin component of MazEF toxin-antitoxin module
MDRKPLSRTVTDLGGSLGVSIPESVAEKHEIGTGDEVALDYDREEGAIKYILE